MLVSKEFKFEAAHRLMSSYTEACQKIHGHSYKVKVEINAICPLNEDGMVLDFKKLKDLINPLFELLDHSLILCNKDHLYYACLTSAVLNPCVTNLVGDKWPQNLDPDIILMDCNPTAENMAITFFNIISLTIGKKMPEFVNSVLTIRVFETATSEAVYRAAIKG